MAIKQILFNTEMVRAILDGRKSCTRRILKGAIPFDEKAKYWNVLKKGEWSGPICVEHLIKQCSPYQPGDTLYVRETWTDHYIPDENGKPKLEYCYKADGIDIKGECLPGENNRWYPSIHMPKEAARIWLKVTDVRVERLQEISGDDLIKEGIDLFQSNYLRVAFDEFKNIWNSTIKKSDLDRYGWNANSWVWVIEFERCEKPE